MSKPFDLTLKQATDELSTSLAIKEDKGSPTPPDPKVKNALLPCDKE